MVGNPGFPRLWCSTLIAAEAVIAGVALALVILIKQAWKTFDSEIIFRFIRGGVTDDHCPALDACRYRVNPVRRDYRDNAP